MNEGPSRLRRLAAETNRGQGAAGHFVRRPASPPGVVRALAASLILYDAYWAWALVANPVFSLLILHSAVLPLCRLRVSWPVFLVVPPVVGLALSLAAWKTSKRAGAAERGKAGRALRTFWLFSRLTLVGLLVASFWTGLRLHRRPLSCAAMALLLAGTYLALRAGRKPARPRAGLSSLRANSGRLAAAVFILIEATLLAWGIALADQRSYGRLFMKESLRPVLRRLLKADLDGLDLNAIRARPSGTAQGVADFGGARLEGASLVGTKARAVNFRMAKLGTALLDGADVEDADFESADLTQVDLHFARAAGVDFSRSIMIGTRAIGGGDFRKAIFRSVRLSYSKWIGVDARGSDWSGSSFWTVGVIFGSNFAGADFSGAHLEQVNLMKDDFSGANFRDAKLLQAQLWHSVLRDANFEGADLRGTDADADQLGAAATLFRAKLDLPLAEAIRKKYPRLLEDPRTAPSGTGPGPAIGATAR